MVMKLKPIFNRLTHPLTSILVLAMCFAASTARADIFGYVDASGDTHFSTEKLDARYQLFIRGDRAFDSNELAPLIVAPTSSPLFKALTRHPNLRKYETLITAAASENHIDAALMMAMMAAESGFNPTVVSPKGAVGLMQIMPATAQRYGLAADNKASIEKKLTDPKINVRLAARYLRDLQQLFPNQPTLVIASYNAGEHAVQRYKNTVPPFAETRNYVQIVSQFYQLYKPASQSLHTENTGDNASRRIHLTIPGRGNMPPVRTSLN